jgi:hypothetical protein
MEGQLNLLAAWIGFLFGILSGIIPGLLFHKQEWMGGYDSWRRRLTRLGHISFFGIGFLNLGYAFTVTRVDSASYGSLVSLLFIIGAISMPMFCYLSAWKNFWRHFFFIPVSSLGIGTFLTILMIMQS